MEEFEKTTSEEMVEQIKFALKCNSMDEGVCLLDYIDNHPDHESFFVSYEIDGKTFKEWYTELEKLASGEFLVQD